MRMKPLLGRFAVGSVMSLLVVASTAAPTAAEKAAATKGMVKRSELEIVDCLLPGQVRQLGNSSYLTQRRPVRTTASDCSIRGGEYVAYDRADLQSAWRVPEDSIIFASAAQREQEVLRKELDAAVAEKDAQVKLLQKQLKDLQDQ